MDTATRRPTETIPKTLLCAMFGLVLLCLALVTWARLTDRPLEAKPADGPIAAERSIIVFGHLDGSAQVMDADGTRIADLPSDKGGFVAGVWRAVQHERRQAGADPDAPVRLIRFEAGGLALRDETTGWRAELIGFGPDNAAAFARLLEPMEG
jgi:putative photosynthetic complex assembly protein